MGQIIFNVSVLIIFWSMPEVPAHLKAFIALATIASMAWR